MAYKTNTKVINLFGGPGSGKSTLMAGIFSKMKKMGLNCEIAPEFAKEVVWEESPNISKVLNNQIYIFGVQQHRIHRLLNKVDYIITDSPILNSILYDPNDDKDFHKLTLNEHLKLNNINFLIERDWNYVEQGRIHDELEGGILHKNITKILNENNIDYYNISANNKPKHIIRDYILK